MKNKWIMLPVVLLAVFGLLVGCDNGGGGGKPSNKTPTKEWVVPASAITLTAIGGNASDGTVDGNKYTLVSTEENSGNVGFCWVLPTTANSDGFLPTDYEDVKVTVKILAISSGLGISYMAKKDRQLDTDVTGGSVTTMGATGAESSKEFPVKEFSGELAFQYAYWNEALGAGRTDPNHQIEVNFTFLPKQVAPPPGGGGGENKPQKVTLEDNYQYGSNYQSNAPTSLRWDRLFNADAFVAGDKFEIEFEFTVSRDLEEDLECQIVWSPGGTPSYWESVSLGGNLGPSERIPDPDAPDTPSGPYTPPAGSVGYTKDGGPYTRTLELEIRSTTKQSSVPVGTVARNATHLVVWTKGIGNVGTAGSGAKGPVDIDFTKLIVTKK